MEEDQLLWSREEDEMSFRDNGGGMSSGSKAMVLLAMLAAVLAGIGLLWPKSSDEVAVSATSQEVSIDEPSKGAVR